MKTASMYTPLSQICSKGEERYCFWGRIKKVLRAMFLSNGKNLEERL